MLELGMIDFRAVLMETMAIVTFPLGYAFGALVD